MNVGTDTGPRGTRNVHLLRVKFVAFKTDTIQLCGKNRGVNNILNDFPFTANYFVHYSQFFKYLQCMIIFIYEF